MPAPSTFLADLNARPLSASGQATLTAVGLHVGLGQQALEVAVLSSRSRPAAASLHAAWLARRARRATPVLLVVLYDGKAAICGPTGEQPPVHHDLNVGQTERLCREALRLPDRHAALRFLAQALPSLATAIPGVRNEGLLALHELEHGAPQRPDWSRASEAARGATGRSGSELLSALGFRLERLDNLTQVLRAGDRRTALAVLLEQSESAEASTARFNSLSPISYALAKADSENLRWVVLVQGNRLRLYPTEVGVGVGRRGRTETFVEVQPALLSDEHLAFLWLLFSADALKAGGTMEELLESSGRFAGHLAERLRDRIYTEVVPRLAGGIAEARKLRRFTADELRVTYQMALTVLFRLLFIAYAEDRDLLPYRYNEAYRRRSLKQKALELAEASRRGTPIARGDSHWREVTHLFEAVASGNTEWGVPAYDGGLFSSDDNVSVSGAKLVNLTLRNEVFEPALRGLLLVETSENGLGPVDFRSLSVREFGTIYEGLLEAELSIADSDLTLNKDGTYVPAKPGQAVETRKGDVYLHDRSGARKSSGSYYTKTFAVEHLLEQALEPALRDHFARLDERDDVGAAEALFDFRVADIAMGSGHFLVAAIDRIERGIGEYVTRRPLPGLLKELTLLRTAAEGQLGDLAEQTHIEDGQLLRRLIARRCIYGVDANDLSVQLARLSIWIHTFVPGLPLSLLDHSLVLGNSLVGVGTIDEIRQKFAEHGGGLFPVDADSLLGHAAKPLKKLATLADATLKDVDAARLAMTDAAEAIAPTKALCDIITALPIADDIQFQFANWQREKERVIGSKGLGKAQAALTGLHVLHFPVKFPEVFLRERSGFDVILGNPPWEKVRTELHEFWARHFPGLRALNTRDREEAVEQARAQRPDLEQVFLQESAESEKLRNALRGLPGMNTGHPDLFRAFIWRYLNLLADSGGRIGVVLPAEAFKIKGVAALRQHIVNMLEEIELQFLLNRRKWVFDEVHPQKSVTLFVGKKGTSAANRFLRMRSGASSEQQWRTTLSDENVVERNIEWLRSYSPLLVVPSIAGRMDMELIDRFLSYPKLSEHPQIRVRRIYADFETTRDRSRYILTPTEGSWPVYKGESFDLWNPDTGIYFAWAPGRTIAEAAQQRRLRASRGSAYFEMGSEWLQDPSTHPILFPRIAFRRTTNRTNRRTLIAALIPPNVVTTEDAPWILWLDADRELRLEAMLLGAMSSIIVDWWARRFVEGKVEQEVFNSLRFPGIITASKVQRRIADLAGRLAAVDSRFLQWAQSVGVDCGLLEADAKEDMIHELDAVVAHLYGLSEDQLRHIFETFHEGWNCSDRLADTIKHYRTWADRSDS